MLLFYEIDRILIAAAVIPAILLLIFVYRADKMEREPFSLLLSLVWRGVIATMFALYAERFGSRLLAIQVAEDSVLYRILLYFVVVACSEEGFKYLLLYRRTWNSPDFNCQFDAVVYAVFVSLGFALWENIDYVLMYGFDTALIRAVTAVPGHACFGVFMGAFYGLAKRYDCYGRKGKSKIFRILAFVIPVLLHGCYDYIATLESDGLTWLFVAFILVLFLISLFLVRRLSDHDRYIGNDGMML